jgi:hypothetical protein
MLAAGLLHDPREFLAAAAEQPMNVLIDDLRERMTVFPNSLRSTWERSVFQEHATWEAFQQATANHSPITLCDVLGRPLLAGYGFGPRDVDRVTWAAHVCTCRRLGFDPREFLMD